MWTKKFPLFVQCMDCVLNGKATSTIICPLRGLRYNKKGGLIGGRKKRLPFNWKDVNFNPARIPSAWKPKDWNQKQVIDYEYEKELAKYIPGYEPKIPNFLQENYHETPIYTVDQHSNLSEGLKQALFLTKSVIAEKGLPSKILALAESAATTEQDDLAIQVFRHAHLFDVDPAVIPKYKSHFRVRKYKFDNFLIFPSVERYCPLIVLELIRLCQTRTFQLSDEFHKRLILENVASTACFERECPSMVPPGVLDFPNEWKFRLSSRPNVQLQSQVPLTAFANEQMILSTINNTLPSLYPTTPIIDVEKTNCYDFVNNTGIASKSSRQFLHTMVLFNIKQLKPNLLYSTMLTQMFSFLYSKAVEMFGSFGTTRQGMENRSTEFEADARASVPAPTPQDLPQPLSAQCFASDGRLFQFMCLQLNTTNLHTDDGIKNMVWVDNEKVSEELYNEDDTMTPFAMYSECSHTTWKSPDYYLGYNPDVFKLLQGFWLNGAL